MPLTASSSAKSALPQALLTTWRDPPRVFLGKPFWCWNGKLEKDELLRQLAVFKEMGMGGVFMHSRTGLATEYLGDRWFDLVNTCSDEAARLGLEAWLYDEDRWPSGSAGGLATSEDRYRMKYLRLKILPEDTDWEAIEWPEERFFVAAFEAEMDGLNLGNYQQVERFKAPAQNRKLLIFAWEHMAAHTFYNGGSYLDTLNRMATEHFLNLTHDRYAEKCGERIGTAIRGIFTDEPHRGFVMCDRHGQPGPSETAWLTPWTELLPTEFEKAFGRDLIPNLPELYLRKDDEPISRVKWEYMELIQRLFLENWARPLQERCHKFGMTLTGHVLHEDSLSAQAVPCGSVMRYYEFLDYPGVDVLSLDNRKFWIVKQLTSVGRQMGKPWLLSELYGCSGWQLGFDGHKRIGDWQALFGINIRCHHLSWYSMGGECKRDYPASIFFQSSWYREYAIVENYFSRLNVLLQVGKPRCDVLVINPIETLWAQISAGWTTWLESTDPAVKALETAYRELFGWLTASQIDFDYGDEDHLSRFGELEEGYLRLGKMRYRTVLVSGMQTIRGSTLDLIQRFRAAGGKVIFIGEPPTHVDARPSKAACAFALEVGGPVAADTDAVHACGGVAADWECGSPHLLCQVRQDGGHWVAVILNPEPNSAFPNVIFRARISGSVAELDCLRGDVFAHSTTAEGGWVSWETSFAPLQERAFLIGPGADVGHSPRSLPKLNAPFILPGPFPYELDEPNLCVLDFAAWQVNGSGWQPEIEILKIEEALAARYGVPARSGQMLQPWAEDPPTDQPLRRLQLLFRFGVETLPAHAISLMLEQPSRYHITFNGISIEPIAETMWFIDPCFRVVPLDPEIVREGENEILLECDYQKGHELEAIYLLGEFGVELTGRMARLTRLPTKLAVGDLCKQGLPFYSGKVRYLLPTGHANHLTLPDISAACVNFRSVSDAASYTVPWAPFECRPQELAAFDGTVIAEFALTRRNTFGPLHLIPIEQDWIGPECFRSEGENWSDSYQLIPVGMLLPPEVRFSEVP